MKLYGTGVFLGVNQRQAKDGKIYTNVNVDFEGDIQNLGASDANPFLKLEKYKPYTFLMQYRTYQKNGVARSFLAVDGVAEQK